MIDVGDATPGQVGLGCVRKKTEKLGKKHSSMVSASVPA